MVEMVVDPYYDYQFRLIVVGDSTVGKSSLLRHFRDGHFSADAEPTVGVDFHAQIVKISPNVQVKLQLWDTAGQERFRAITRSYYRNSAGVLLLYDTSRRSTFEHLDDWLNEAKMQIQPYQAVFLLIGTKQDLEHERQVSIEEARQYAEDRDMNMIETSAKTGSQVREAFNMIARDLYEMVEAGNIGPCEGWEGVKKGMRETGGSGFTTAAHKYSSRINLSDFSSESIRRRCCNY